MAVFDLPLPELREYTGRNPRPDDFDAYWAEALDELERTDPEPRLIANHAVAARNTEFFELWFTGVGGARIHAKYARPRFNTGQCPAVLQFHGYSANSGDWSERLAFSSEGFCTAAMDCRGQGGLSEDPGGVKGTTWRGHIVRGLDDPDRRKLYFRQVFLDTVQLARVVRTLPEVDPTRLAAMGASQGGGLALACTALDPGIRRVATLQPFLSDYQRVWEMDLARDSYEELRAYFRRFDPRHEREAEVFTKLGYIDVQHLASRINAETLLFTGLMDTICPPSTQFAAYNRIPAAKRHVIYPDHGHENLPGAQDECLNFMLGL